MSSSTAVETDKTRACRLTRDFELLRHNPLFSGLHLDVVKLFAYLSTRRTYQPGDVLIQQGEKADKAFVLSEGSAEMTVLHKGREVMLQRYDKEDFFGELALLAQFTWFFSVKAITIADALVIDRAVFQKVLEKFPGEKDRLIERVIQQRVNRFIDQTSLLLDKLTPVDEMPDTPLI